MAVTIITWDNSVYLFFNYYGHWIICFILTTFFSWYTISIYSFFCREYYVCCCLVTFYPYMCKSFSLLFKEWFQNNFHKTSAVCTNNGPGFMLLDTSITVHIFPLWLLKDFFVFDKKSTILWKLFLLLFSCGEVVFRPLDPWKWRFYDPSKWQ